MSTKYIRNENGGIHSIDDEAKDVDGQTAFDRLHEVSPSGKRYLPAGWAEITAADAKKAHPQLFGAPDPLVRMNAAELQNARALRTELADDSKE